VSSARFDDGTHPLFRIDLPNDFAGVTESDVEYG